MVGRLSGLIRNLVFAAALAVPVSGAASEPASPEGGASVPDFLRRLDEHRPDGAQDRNLLPRDDRTQVEDTTVPPYRMIGLLFGESAEGNHAFCTGIVVGARTVLTAAHCLYDEQNEAWRENFLFAPGLESFESAPLGIWSMREPDALSAYISNFTGYKFGRINRDLGLVYFDEPVGEQLGRIPLASDFDMENTPIRLIGYHGDKALGTMWEETCVAALDPDLDSGLMRTRGCSEGFGADGGVALVEHGGEFRVAGIVVGSDRPDWVILPLVGDLAEWVGERMR